MGTNGKFHISFIAETPFHLCMCVYSGQSRMLKVLSSRKLEEQSLSKKTGEFGTGLLKGEAAYFEPFICFH